MPIYLFLRMLLNPFFWVNVLHCVVVLGVHMCFVMVIFVFVLFFFLVRDPFILAHAIGALLYLCIYWSVQHKKNKNKKKRLWEEVGSDRELDGCL